MNNSQPAAEAARLIWPITQQGKMIAQQFASRHEHPATAERVRQKTLAVWVVYELLDTLGIAADLSTSDSWNPAIQLTEDVADLVIQCLRSERAANQVLSAIDRDRSRSEPPVELWPL